MNENISQNFISRIVDVKRFQLNWFTVARVAQCNEKKVSLYREDFAHCQPPAKQEIKNTFCINCDNLLKKSFRVFPFVFSYPRNISSTCKVLQQELQRGKSWARCASRKSLLLQQKLIKVSRLSIKTHPRSLSIKSLLALSQHAVQSTGVVNGGGKKSLTFSS